MKPRFHKSLWALLILILSLTGLLAWAGWSLLGEAQEVVATLDDGQPSEEQDVSNPGDEPLGKGLGGLELDRGQAVDLQVDVDVLALLDSEEADEAGAGFGDGLASLHMLSSSRGKPVPFRWRFEAGPEAGREAESQGEETLRGLRPGWYLLSLLGPGGAHAPRLLQLRADRERTVSVNWAYPARTRGRVFGPQGEPVSGASVRIGRVETKTDKEGRFELDGLWPGSGLPLLIEAEGLASRVEAIGVVGSSEPPAELRFVLEEGAVVEGLVEMPREEWKHARLAVLPGRSSGRSRTGRGYAHLPLFWKGRFSDLRLDAKGHFRIQGLSRTLPLALGIVHPRYRLAMPVSLPVLERIGKPHVQVLLRPEAMRVIAGKVTAQDGKPVQARLEMRGKGRWGEAYFRGGVRPPLESYVAGMGNTVAASDPLGRYSLGVPDRTSVLRVQAQGFATLQEPAPAGRRADLQMEREGKDGRHDREGPIVLRLRFASEVTQEGRVRAIRLHLRMDGRARSEPVIIDPRDPYELHFEKPSRLRISVGTLGVERGLSVQDIELQGSRSLSLQ